MDDGAARATARVERALGPYRRRLLARWGIRGAATGLAAGALVAALLRVASTRWISLLSATEMAAILLVFTAAGALRSLVGRREVSRRAARICDHRLGGRQVVAAALECAREAGMGRVLAEEALALLDGGEASRVVPLFVRMPLPGLAVALLALGASCFLPPVAPAAGEGHPSRLREDLAVAARSLDAWRDRIEVRGLPASRETADELAAALRRLAAQADEPEEVLRRLARLEEKAEERLHRMAADGADGAAAESLGRSALFAEAGRAARGGDWSGAEDAMVRALRASAAKGAGAEAAARALRQVGEDLSEYLNRHVQDEAEMGERRETDRAWYELAQELRKISPTDRTAMETGARELARQGRLRRANRLDRETLRNMIEALRTAKGRLGAPPSATTSGEAFALALPVDMPPLGSGAKGGEGSGPGEGQGAARPGTGRNGADGAGAPGEGDAPPSGGGEGEDGSGSTNREEAPFHRPVEGRDGFQLPPEGRRRYEALHEARRREVAGLLSRITGASREAGPGAVDRVRAAPVPSAHEPGGGADRVELRRAEAERAMARERVPRAYRRSVREYFERLRQAEGSGRDEP